MFRVRLQLTKVLWEKYGVASDYASAICSSYLKNFKKCPDNPSMDLDTWRMLLWSQALGEKYNGLTDEVYKQWLNLRYHYLALPQDTQKLLQKLRQNYFLALITNGPSSAQWEKIRRLDLQKHFDVIQVSGDLPWEKPHHKIFHEACDFLGVQPSQCIMVGDKLETDIQGAVEAKFAASVWVPLANCDGGLEGFRPDFVIKSVVELPTVLPKNPQSGFRTRLGKNKARFVPEFDDCNSNGSDGS